MLKNPGAIAGKNVYVHGGPNDVTTAQLREYLSRFPTNATLRDLGRVSFQIEKSAESILRIGNTIIMGHSLPYLALLAIESSSDTNGVPMTGADLERAAYLYLNLQNPSIEKLATEDKVAIEYLIRDSQFFNYQSELRHRLPRAVLLLKEIWPKVDEAKGIHPLDDIEKITGVDLDRLLFMGWAVYAGSENGYFCRFPAKNVTGLPLCTIEEQEAFLKWVSADYATIRDAGREHAVRLPADEKFDRFRFNPLTVYPLVRPNVQPVADAELFLVPSHRLLFERIHTGLYHVLADHYKGTGSKNPFRVAFGHVFQRYVGMLLEQALGKMKVLPERSYHAQGGHVDTVDWIVVEGDRGVLIEVKQSALYLPTKTLGDVESAKKDLQATLKKAVEQLKRTEGHIRGGLPGLEDLTRVQKWERLVVTYDSVHWVNSFLFDLIKADMPGSTPDVQFASIDEFEYLLGRCRSEPLSAILERKRTARSDTGAMDFKDWLARHRSKTLHENPFLSDKYYSIQEMWGIPRPRKRRVLLAKVKDKNQYKRRHRKDKKRQTWKSKRR